ncbi:MAG TPA: Do family serine endopeptidase [Rhodocyclaceae bacterium]|nr:Do family serine endopeptidase [Rhodocyclaceae bacterium]
MSTSTIAATPRDLPEFASLVEHQAAVVVNISATQSARTARAHAPYMQDDPGDDDNNVPGWLRRFVPKMHPQDPQGSQDPDDNDGDDGDGAVGSGFIISSDGYVLTNTHVVEGADEVLVRLNDKREFAARIIGMDKRSDIALLKLDATGLPKAVFGDPAKLRVGDWVLAIGSPFGFDSSVTAGIVSAKGRALPDETLVPFIQTDVAINPGNSGGPLFNLKGEVVGINSQIYSRSGGFMGISFAIPIDVAMDVQAQLRQQGRVSRGRIGVMIQDITKEMADSFGLPQPVGALVSGIEPNSPAEKAGVKVGDVIVRFDGKAVTNSIDLPRVVSATHPGVNASMQLWRHGTSKTLSVAVAEFPEEAKLAVNLPAPEPQGGNRLGLVTQDLSRDQKRDMKLELGASIREASGPAARAALRPGDVVTAVIAHGQTTDVRSADHFNRVANGLAGGSALTLLVRRGESQSFVGMKVPATK